jgi:AraC-like DNA-binding protein
MPEFIENSKDLKVKQLSELETVLAGWEDCAPGHFYGPTVRSHELIHFITRGQGQLTIGGRTFTAAAGDAFLIPAEEMSYYIADQKTPWHYAWIGFTGTHAARYMHQLQRASEGGYILHGLNTEKYTALLRKAGSLSGASLQNYLMCQSVLLEVLSNLVSDLSADLPDQSAPSLAEKIKFYLDIKYNEKTPVSEIAAIFGVHPNYLTRVFREKYQTSPKKYLLSLKMKRAASLLAASDLPVALIAASVGFDDQAAFSKSFKKVYGRSPSEFR